MKKSIFAFLLVLLSFTSHACEVYFQSEDLCMTISWEKYPRAREKGIMAIGFTDAKDQQRLVDPKFSPAIVLWMTSMGHGSSPVTLVRTDVGQFRSTDVLFIMGGPWDIKFQLKDGAKVVEEKVKSVNI